MKLQKIILCTAIALCAFGASLGLLEIGAYIRAAVQPMKVEFKAPEPIQPPVYAPPQKPDYAPPAAAKIEETAPEVEEEPQDWGNTGDYYVVGEKPRGFEDFFGLDIIDREWNEKAEKVVPVKPRGNIDIYLVNQDKNREFDYSTIKIKGTRLSFVTETKRGVSYRFEGRFVNETVTVKDEINGDYEENILLKGRLSKWRDGKKIAVANFRLAMSHGC